jgi:ankyrin repeat protein
MHCDDCRHYSESNVIVECARCLLDCGADPNLKDDVRQTPLHSACRCGSGTACVQLLLNYGANIERTDMEWRTPLHIACCCKRALSTVALLLNRGANLYATDTYMKTPFHVSCEKGNELIVQLLLCTEFSSIGAVFRRFPWVEAGVKQASQIVQYSSELKSIWSSEVKVKSVLLMGADVAGNTPLHSACINEHLTLIPILLLRGADIGRQNCYGCTPGDLLSTSQGQDYMKRFTAWLRHNSFNITFAHSLENRGKRHTIPVVFSIELLKSMIREFI